MRLFLCICAAMVMSLEAGAAERPAEEIIKMSGVKGGFIVHIGDNTDMTAALYASDSYLVQSLDTDPARVARAREHLLSRGLYGKVSVRTFDGCRLPYVDGLVNLVVADDLGDVTMTEVMRVLAPRGVAVVGGKKSVKPWSQEIDEWTHYLYDASGNAVSKDRRVGPPRHLQWTADPRWARSHEHAASVAAMVSGSGKIFYLHDEGISGIIVRDLPERWALYARDAFSGILLWKKTFSGFGSTAWNGVWHCREPMEIPRRLVFGGGKVYATLGFRKSAISEIDPDTGRILASFEDGKNNDELVWHDGVLLVRQRRSLRDYPLKGGSSGAVLAKSRQDGQPDIPAASMGDETIVALDAGTGKVLWSREESRVVTMSLAARGERVCYHNFQQLVCLNLRNGHELWRTESPTWPDITGVGGTLLIYNDKVAHSGSRGTQVFSLAKGERLWKGHGLHRMSVRHPPDLFAIDDRLWSGPTPKIAGAGSYADSRKTPSAAPLLSGTSVKGIDVNTGEVTKELDVGKLVTPGHHTRCYRSKATSRFLIWPKRGMEFVDVTGEGDHERIDWARGECGYGIMPSGGLVYVPPHPCVCYLGVALDGFNALSPADELKTKQPDLKAGKRLQRGPAYGGVRTSDVPDEDAWPMFRHDAGRSGRTASMVPAELKRQWDIDIGGELTQPVVADDTVYVASIDTHTVYARSADSGQPRWHFTANARIDSPPTIHRGLVLFGCTDGKVYCLRASDGELAWRFHAAPVEAHCVVRGQVESRWPVHGAVLVQQGVAYFSAGRSSFLDGGICLYGLDPATGELLHQFHLDGPWSDSCEDSSACYAMEGAKTDVLTAFRNDTETIRATTDTSKWKGRVPKKIRAAAVRWERFIPIRARGMVLAKDTLFLAGVPDVLPKDDPYAALDGRRGALLWALSKEDGAKISELMLEAPPVFDGIAAANGRLYMALTTGELLCLGD